MSFSLRIARLFGLEVRLHWTLFIYAAFLIGWPWPESEQAVLWRFVFVGLLFGSVLAHEMGHAFTGRFCDGESDQIVLWPLGGLASVHLPNTPAAHFLTTLAGPLVSVGLWTGAVLGEPMSHGWLSTCLRQLAQINFMIWTFNLIPAFPMDGGRLLHAILWRGFGYARATWICTNLALGVAIGILIWSFFLLPPNSLLLFAIAAFIFFSAWQQRQIFLFEETRAEYWWKRPGVAWNHPYRHTQSTKRALVSRLFGRWKGKAEKPKRTKRQLSKEEFIRREVDPILEKIKAGGLQSLTSNERQILEEAGRKIGDRV